MYFLFVYECFTCVMYVYHMHALCSQRSEDRVRAPGTRLTGAWELLCEHLEQYPGPLQKSQVLLAAEPSISPSPQMGLGIFIIHVPPLCGLWPGVDNVIQLGSCEENEWEIHCGNKQILIGWTLLREIRNNSYISFQVFSWIWTNWQKLSEVPMVHDCTLWASHSELYP